MEGRLDSTFAHVGEYSVECRHLRLDRFANLSIFFSKYLQALIDSDGDLDLQSEYEDCAGDSSDDYELSKKQLVTQTCWLLSTNTGIIPSQIKRSAAICVIKSGREMAKSHHLRAPPQELHRKSTFQFVLGNKDTGCQCCNRIPRS